MKNNRLLATQKLIKEKTGLHVVLSQEGMAKIEIAPTDCGAVAPIFNEITLTIKLEEFDYSSRGGREGFLVTLAYKYTHSGVGVLHPHPTRQHDKH